MTDLVAVRRHLRRLDRPALAAFLADLYATRGYDTEVADEGYVLANRDGATTVLWTVPARRTPRVPGWRSKPHADADVDVDVVVAPGLGPESDAVWPSTSVGSVARLDGDGLAEMLWYGVDVDERERLCRRHFGRPPAALAPGLTTRVRRAARTLGQSLDAGSGQYDAPFAMAVALLTVVVFAVAAAGLTTTPLQSSVGSETTTVTSDEPATGDEAVTGNSSTQVGVFVPGLNGTGVVDAERLATTHHRLLAGRSYQTLHTVIRPTGSDGEFSVRSTTTRVSADGPVYRQRIHCGTDLPFVATYVTDGERNVARYTGQRVTYRVEPVSPSEVPAPRRRTAYLIRVLLNGSESSLDRTTTVHGDSVRVRVRGRAGGAVLPAGATYSAAALVTERGLVRRLEVSYAVDQGNRTRPGRIEVTYPTVDDVFVVTPEWYSPGLQNGSGAVSGERWYQVGVTTRRRCRSLVGELGQP